MTNGEEVVCLAHYFSKGGVIACREKVFRSKYHFVGGLSELFVIFSNLISDIEVFLVDVIDVLKREIHTRHYVVHASEGLIRKLVWSHVPVLCK